MSGRVFEGRWICPSCGAENLGRYESCEGEGSSGCGVARPTDVRFYLPDDSPVVTDPDLLADARSGQDWNCAHCDGANKGAIRGAVVSRCVHCGNARGGEDAATPVRAYALGQAPQDGATAQRLVREEARSASAQRRAARVAQNTDGQAAPRDGLTPLAKIGAALVVVLVLLGVWFLRAPIEASGRVDRLEWSWTIPMERYVTLTDEGFHSPPGDATVLRQEQRQNGWKTIVVGTRQVTTTETVRVPSGQRPYACGMTDKGNGYFEERICYETTYTTQQVPTTRTEDITQRVPDIQTWRSWSYQRWRVVDTFRNSGTGRSPEAPDTPLLRADERLGASTVLRDVVVLTTEGEVLRMEGTDALWSKADPGDVVRWTTNRMGTIRDVVVE